MSNDFRGFRWRQITKANTSKTVTLAVAADLQAISPERRANALILDIACYRQFEGNAATRNTVISVVNGEFLGGAVENAQARGLPIDVITNPADVVRPGTLAQGGGSIAIVLDETLVMMYEGAVGAENPQGGTRFRFGDKNIPPAAGTPEHPSICAARPGARQPGRVRIRQATDPSIPTETQRVCAKLAWGGNAVGNLSMAYVSAVSYATTLVQRYWGHLALLNDEANNDLFEDWLTWSPDFPRDKSQDAVFEEVGQNHVLYYVEAVGQYNERQRQLRNSCVFPFELDFAWLKLYPERQIIPIAEVSIEFFLTLSASDKLAIFRIVGKKLYNMYFLDKFKPADRYVYVNWHVKHWTDVSHVANSIEETFVVDLDPGMISLGRYDRLPSECSSAATSGLAAVMACMTPDKYEVRLKDYAENAAKRKAWLAYFNGQKKLGEEALNATRECQKPTVIPVAPSLPSPEQLKLKDCLDFLTDAATFDLKLRTACVASTAYQDLKDLGDWLLLAKSSCKGFPEKEEKVGDLIDDYNALKKLHGSADSMEQFCAQAMPVVETSTSTDSDTSTSTSTSTGPDTSTSTATATEVSTSEATGIGTWTTR